ncbi:hypothetical protein GCM10023318_00150 [Nocardia callitridis]|uniref:DNA 3'-5' helicase n=1 Tax=Nocardia callitridis TaxID=648753 RepID=A0ABP9JRB6_9NOCA
MTAPGPRTWGADVRALFAAASGAGSAHQGWRPWQVLGGPGTGKTSLLVDLAAERIAEGADTESVLLLTHSKQAALAVRDAVTVRMAGAVPGATRDPLARTVHSYAFAVLRRQASVHGNPPPRLLTGAEQDATLREMLRGDRIDIDAGAHGLWPQRLWPALDVGGFAEQLRDLMLRATERGIGPEDLIRLGREQSMPEWVAAGRFATRYEQTMLLRWAVGVEAPEATAPALDAAELVGAALDALAADPALLAAERARIGYLLVDDAQHLDPQAAMLVRAIGRGAHTTVIAGDPDQGIFTFRGADPGFAADPGAPEGQRIVLRDNHRSGAAVGTAVSRVVARLPGSAPQRFATESVERDDATSSAEVLVRVLATPAKEAALIADHLRRAHLTEGVAWSRMAVIVRSVPLSLAPLRRALLAAGVPVQQPALDTPLARRRGAAWMLLSLRAILAGEHAGRAELFTADDALDLLSGPLGGADQIGLRRLRRGVRRSVLQAQRGNRVGVPADAGARTVESEDDTDAISSERADDPREPIDRERASAPDTVPRDPDSAGETFRPNVIVGPRQEGQESFGDGMGQPLGHGEDLESQSDSVSEGAFDAGDSVSRTDGSFAGDRGRFQRATRFDRDAADADWYGLDTDADARDDELIAESDVWEPEWDEPDAGDVASTGPKAAAEDAPSDSLAVLRGRLDQDAASGSAAEQANSFGEFRDSSAPDAATSRSEGAQSTSTTSDSEPGAVSASDPPVPSGREGDSEKSASDSTGSVPWGQDEPAATSSEGGVDEPTVDQPSAETLRDLIIGVGDPAVLARLTDVEAAALRRVLDALDRARKARRRGAGLEDVLWALWTGARLQRRWVAQSERGGAIGMQADRDLDAAVGLFDAAATYVDRLPKASVQGFVEYLTQQQIPFDSSARTVDGGGVALLSAHAAAGREWDVVAVAAVQEGIWPNPRSRGTLLRTEDLVDVVAGIADAGERVSRAAPILAEERRLLLVACSRARRSLLVTAVESVSGERDLVPSRFLAELLGHDEAVEPGALPIVDPGRALALHALVAELRGVVCDIEADPARRGRAAHQLARLADAGVPGTHPDSWYGTAELSSSRPLWEADQSAVGLSPSTVELLRTCPLRWALERHGGTDGDNRNAVQGNLVHTLVQALAGNVPEQQVRAALTRAWAAVEPEDGWHSRQELRRTEAMLATFLDWVRRSRGELTQSGVEVPIDCVLPARTEDERPVRIRGRVDRLERDALGRFVIIDVKTGKTPVSKQAAVDHAQLATYQVAAAAGALDPESAREPEEFGAPGGARLVYVAKPSTKDGATQRMQPALDDESVRQWRDTIHDAAAATQGPEYVATRNDGCRHCPVAGSCPVQDTGRQVTDE